MRVDKDSNPEYTFRFTGFSNSEREQTLYAVYYNSDTQNSKKYEILSLHRTYLGACEAMAHSRKKAWEQHQRLLSLGMFDRDAEKFMVSRNWSDGQDWFVETVKVQD